MTAEAATALQPIPHCLDSGPRIASGHQRAITESFTQHLPGLKPDTGWKLATRRRVSDAIAEGLWLVRRKQGLDHRRRVVVERRLTAEDC